MLPTARIILWQMENRGEHKGEGDRELEKREGVFVMGMRVHIAHTYITYRYALIFCVLFANMRSHSLHLKWGRELPR